MSLAFLGPLFLVLSLLTASVGRAGGGWTGVGGDLFKDQDNSWFIGDDIVEYCVERGPNFPESLEGLEALVADSLKDWMAFFRVYKMDERLLGESGTLGGLFPDRKRRGLTLGFKQVSKCTPREKQIQFLFGSSKPEVDLYRSTRNYAFAFSLRPDYDHQTYRNGGFVWVPDTMEGKAIPWTEHPQLLKHALLHELGHVFGMRHDSTFVMSSTVAVEITERLKTPVSTTGSEYGQIEHPSWPYRVASGKTADLTFGHGGAMGIPLGYRANQALPLELREALRMDTAGAHKLKLEHNDSEKEISIKFEELNSNTLYFLAPSKRRFSWRGYDNGPGIYTRWLDDNGKATFTRVGFDIDGDVLPLESAVKINGETFPILISLEPKANLGIRQSEVVLKIYLSKTNSWWTSQ